MSDTKMRHIPTVDFLSNKDQIQICDVCPKAKQHRLPFPLSTISTVCTFELIHVDTWGPYHTKTHGGQRYFLTIVDDFSRVTWTHLMVTKDEAISVLRSFILMAKTQY